jgi:hypothetical protein
VGHVIKFPRETRREKRRPGLFQADWPPVNAFWNRLYERGEKDCFERLLINQLGPDEGRMLHFEWNCKFMLKGNWC